MATRFIEQQLDYIYFLYGLSFVALAACCANLRPTRTRKLPWRWFKYFALAHGICVWLGIIKLGSGGGPLLSSLRLALLALSFVFLVEFGRVGMRELRGRAPSRWIHLPLLAAAGLGALAGAHGLQAGIRYALGLVGSVWAAAAFARAAQAEPAARGMLILAAVILVGFGFSDGLVGPPALFFPASRFNHAAFLAWTGLPIQLIRGVLAFGLSAAIWSYYRRTEHWLYPEAEALQRHQYGFKTAGLCLVLAAGWGLTDFVGRDALSEGREVLLKQAQIAAVGLDGAAVARAMASPEPASDAAYRLLQDRLQEMGKTDHAFCRLYLVFLKGDRVGIIAPAQPARRDQPSIPPQPTPPGWAAAVLKSGGVNERALWNDDGGALVSAFAPIRLNPASPVIALVGIDASGEELRREIARHRAAPICITLLLSLLLIGSFVLRRRFWESARQMVLSERSLNEAQRVAQTGSWTYSPQREQFSSSEELRRIFGLDGHHSQPTFGDFDRLALPEDRPRLRAAVNRALATGDPFEMELRIARPDGSLRQLLARAQTRRGIQGDIIELVGTIQDITEYPEWVKQPRTA